MKKGDKPTSDQEIIDSLKKDRGIEGSVRYLYKAYFERLSYYITNNQGNEQDAEDFFQEGVVVLIDSIRSGKFRGDSQISTYLYAIVRNLWRNELKRRKRSLDRETRYYEESPKSDESAQAALRATEVKREVASLLLQLHPDCQKIFNLFFYQNKSMEEIHQEMGYKNEQNARNRKYKCMKEIHKILDANEEIKQHFKNLLVNG